MRAKKCANKYQVKLVPLYPINYSAGTPITPINYSADSLTSGMLQISSKNFTIQNDLIEEPITPQEGHDFGGGKKSNQSCFQGESIGIQGQNKIAIE